MRHPTPPTWLFALRFAHSPPRMSVLARPSYPSRFVPIVAFPCTALSPTTQGHSKDKALSGISPVPDGDSPVICPCDLGKPSH